MYITQCDIDSDFKVCVITSTGFVIEETDEHIVLAGDLIDDDARRVIVIPKENIV